MNLHDKKCGRNILFYSISFVLTITCLTLLYLNQHQYFGRVLKMEEIICIFYSLLIGVFLLAYFLFKDKESRLVTIVSAITGLTMITPIMLIIAFA